MLNHPIPSMNPSLQKVSEWRNSGNPNLIKKASTSVACIGIGATSLISSTTSLFYKNVEFKKVGTYYFDDLLS